MERESHGKDEPSANEEQGNGQGPDTAESASRPDSLEGDAKDDRLASDTDTPVGVATAAENGKENDGD